MLEPVLLDADVDHDRLHEKCRDGVALDDMFYQDGTTDFKIRSGKVVSGRITALVLEDGKVLTERETVRDEDEYVSIHT